jgi:hypothetical protein
MDLLEMCKRQGELRKIFMENKLKYKLNKNREEKRRAKQGGNAPLTNPKNRPSAE